MATPTRCVKCDGRMTEGHLLDAHYGEGAAGQTRWQPGAILRRWWGGIKVDKEAARDVMSYRCERCGYLESYAR